MRSFVILTAFTNIADWKNLCCQCALYWGKLIIKKICLLYLLVWLILDCQLSWEILPLYQTVLVSPNQDLEEGLFVIPLLLPLSSYSGSQLIVGMKGPGQPWGFSEQVILHKFQIFPHNIIYKPDIMVKYMFPKYGFPFNYYVWI